MSSQAGTLLTEAEYLELERQAEFRSEYFRGQMFAMSGGSPRHAWIIGNIVGALWQQLRAKPCRVSSSDLRLRVTPAGLYTYPDVMVVCGEVEFADDGKDTVLNPVLIVEVLSQSTQDYDRGRKFQFYRSLPSSAEYLAVAQERPHIEHWSRQPENRWLLAEFSDSGQSISLDSIGCMLSLAEVYDKIDWTAGDMA